MPPTADFSKSLTHDSHTTTNPISRAWKEDRIDIPSSLLGRGQENASTARHNLEERIDSKKKSPEPARTRGRQNSLRNVKNSNEVLRQRSVKRNNKDQSDVNVVVREGRRFEVANVGNNGKIYLRPTNKPSQAHQPPPPAYPANTTLDSPDPENSVEKKRWSDTQASKTPTRRAQQYPTDPPAQQSNSPSGRSSVVSQDSLVTLGPEENEEHGTYKVVINNGLAQQEVADPLGDLDLDVSIPHYRLGTPRFSTRGTAFLSSQVYSRASTTEDIDSTIETAHEYDNVFALPNGLDGTTTLQLQQSPQPQATKGVPMRMPITTIAPVFHKAREPIVPGIYDSIAANPDHPSIVRYAMTTREISAASPARIIAQVTSENFLNYELLSDFFLTVRAYLSTNDLLEYLLARFEWAVDKFDDSGKKVRVRAFAAIRHWVLNYFPYDFVVDRDLRVKFCNRLNALANHVSRGPHDASNLKLIIDLKKCWNGRCALYWDDIGDDIETRHDRDINPGGIVGSRDSGLTHPNQLWAKLASTSTHQVDQEKSVAALHNWVDSVIEAEVDGKSKSDRQESVPSPQHPTSVLSEQSTIPANSCSLPMRNYKAYQHGRNPGPYPVTAVLPNAAHKACPPAPSSQSKDRCTKAKVDHQRSGSFSDALRDKRTSLGAIQEGQTSEEVVMSFPFSGSLVRGSAFPPGSPFIDNLTPQGSGSSLKKQCHQTGVPSEKIAERQMSPGVRNLLSNIRRAWSNKPNVPAAVATDLIPPTSSLLLEKHSNLPMHIAFKIEGFGDQYHQLEALKRNARIDLLCADVTDMFERTMPADGKGENKRPNSARTSSATEQERSSPDSWQHLAVPEREKLQRNHSEVTNGSRSILIVDDTSSEPPVPVIPASYGKPGELEASYDMTDVPLAMAVNQDRIPGMSANLIDGPPPSELPPDFTASDPSSMLPSPPLAAKSSSSKSLKQQASFQSHNGGAGDLSTDSQPTLPPTTFEKPPARMLRRRPGGDLKANQNVHDMEAMPRRGSTGSIATFAESTRDSAVFLTRVNANSGRLRSSGATARERRASNPAPRRSISLVHSKTPHKDIRPSFEAAVAQFARIPDDERGDLEATLLKLEGKLPKSPVGSSQGNKPSSAGSAQRNDPLVSPLTPKTQVSEKQLGSQESVVTPPASSKPTHIAQLQKAEPSKRQPNGGNAGSLYTASEASYDPIPLVERAAGLSARRGQPDQAISDGSNITVPQPLFSPKHHRRDDASSMSDRTRDSYSTMPARRRGRRSIPTMTTDSFLLDDDESLSDISSDLSDDETTDSLLEDAYGSASAGRSVQGTPLPPNVAYGSGYLPSPPMTTENAVSVSSEARRMQEERKPPTPEPSPVSKITESSKSRAPTEVDSCVLKPFANKLHRFPPRRHLPFVLAFDADVLAQQFTLIERDALNEINWQDLIELKWAQAPSRALNWVEYLRYEDPNGIDLVMARYSIVAKWAMSEIVLTHNVEERAQTIVKYIRMAQYARKYHNYATLLQLTLALTSVDTARLHRTWALVPEAERTALKEMESLVSPIRNFHNLRAEMDAADLEDGCIPVVALFLHDLTYNAQKPSVIASTREAEPLINFERYRTTATIVKTLLRLIESSAKYDFKPVDGALERCLWMASLSDDGIRNKSKELEP